MIIRTTENEGVHYAHCLDYDLVADGGTVEEALRTLADKIESQVTFCEVNGISAALVEHPAPERYWKRTWEDDFPERFEKAYGDEVGYSKKRSV